MLGFKELATKSCKGSNSVSSSHLGNGFTPVANVQPMYYHAQLLQWPLVSSQIRPYYSSTLCIYVFLPCAKASH